MTKLIYADESYQILGACFEVYNDKGCGFAEPVYQECLQIEFTYQRIPFSQKPQLHLFYRDQKLKKEYQPDFVCYDRIIIELKALSKLTDTCRAQVLNYLHATDHQLGLLVNFGHYPKLDFERLALTHTLHPRSSA